MSFPRRPLRAALVAAALALAFAGCNLTTGLDEEKLEQNIRDEIRTQTGLELSSIECPADRPLLQGDVFTCTATGTDGRQLTISVTQDDAAGNVSWEVTAETFPSPTP